MSYFLRRSLIGIVFAILVYVGWVLYSGAASLGSTLARFDLAALALALLYSTVNYAFRFLKWELCLGWLKVRQGDGQHPPVKLSLGASARVYLAGLSMSVTPGKIGEVLRSTLLSATHNVAFTRTAPVVLADRLTDLIALVLLSCLGLSLAPETLPWLLVTVALVAMGVLLLGSPQFLNRQLERGSQACTTRGYLRVGKLLDKAQEMVASSAQLLRLSRLAALTGLSLCGWGLECLGYASILEGFAGVSASPVRAAFLWSSTTLIGALSFLPGGLGATEYSLGLLAQRWIPGVTQPIALATTLLIRGATLWYGEVIGAICLAILMRDPRVRQKPSPNAPSDKA